MSATVKVHLLGRDYMLRSQGDPERVQEAAALVDEKLAGLTDSVSVDTRDRIILAMLNLAGECLQEIQKTRQLEQKVEQLRNQLAGTDKNFAERASGLVEQIELALDR